MHPAQGSRLKVVVKVALRHGRVQPVRLELAPAKSAGEQTPLVALSSGSRTNAPLKGVSLKSSHLPKK